MFESEMKKLSIMADIASSHGSRSVVDSSQSNGHCGDVKFGLDAGGAYLELYGKRMAEEDARTLVADLLQSLFQVGCLSWSEEHNRKERYD